MGEKCANPDCEYLANPDPEISVGYCCEKCEGRANGEEWASMGKKKHTAYCTSVHISVTSCTPCAAAAPAWKVAKKAKPAKAKCLHPECEFDANPDPEVSVGYCCEKCEGRANGEEWGFTGKKHTAYCTSKLDDFSYMGDSTGKSSWSAKPKGPKICAHPECNYLVNSDPSISTKYCCEKCEGLHKGEEWAEGGKRHYKNCEKIEAGDPTMAFGGKGGCKSGKYGVPGASAFDPYGMSFMYAMLAKGKGKGGKDGGKDGDDAAKGGGKDKGGFGKGVKGKMMAMMMGGMGVGMGKFGGKGAKSDSGLRATPADQKVWVGELPPGCTVEDLKAHFGLAGSVTCAAMMKGNTAGVAFSSAAEAEAAVLSLNGTEINDKIIIVDAWTGK